MLGMFVGTGIQVVEFVMLVFNGGKGKRPGNERAALGPLDDVNAVPSTDSEALLFGIVNNYVARLKKGVKMRK